MYHTISESINSLSVDRKSWVLERTRKLISRRPYSYVALGRDGETLIIAGEDEFCFTLDSLVPVVIDDKEESDKKGNTGCVIAWVMKILRIVVDRLEQSA